MQSTSVQEERMINMNKKEVMAGLQKVKTRSKWDKAVLQYAFDILEDVEDEAEITEKLLLSGAEDWMEYSYRGCALAYNFEIANRVCTPSEFKRCKEGRYKINKYETWLDVQARALIQAWNLIKSLH